MVKSRVRAFGGASVAAIVGIVTISLFGGVGHPTTVVLAPTPAAATVKAPLTGLLGETGVPKAGYGSVISGYSIGVAWSVLQPSGPGSVTANNFIDKSIANVRAYNAANPSTPLRIKLRVRAGIDAPEWAKNLGGPPVTVTDPQSGITGTVGRFWTAQFAGAYQDLQTQLAALYDGVPEIAEDVASRCTTLTAEPFLRDNNDPASVSNLLAAGFTTAADHQCIQDQFTEHNVWQQTPTGVAFSPYQVINPDGSTLLDFTFPQQMMPACHAALGARCVIENDFLDSNSSTSPSPLMLAIGVNGRPSGFQTAQCSLVGTVVGALRAAVSLGAHAVELCAGYESLVTPLKLAPFPSQLANATFTPPPPAATTISGSATGPFSADVLGTADPKATQTTVKVQYGPTTSYGSTTTPVSVGNIAGSQNLTLSLGSLTPATTYHFRIVAANASGQTVGVDRMVTTPSPPTAATKGATPTPGSATVTGLVNPRGQSTNWWFEWGTDTSYGNATSPSDAGPGTVSLTESATITGLVHGVVYHYRIGAQNASGTSYGNDVIIKGA